MVQRARQISDWSIKLTDFSMARSSQACEDLRDPANNIRYVAPEVLKFGYQNPKAADVWNMGIILFYSIFGYLPFDVKNNNSGRNSNTTVLSIEAEKAIAKEIKEKGFTPKVKPGIGAWFPESMPITKELQQLIRSMLNYDFEFGRWSVLQCLFYLGNISDNDPNANKLCWLCERYDTLPQNWNYQTGMCDNCQNETKDVSLILNKLNKTMMSSRYQFFGWEKISKITNLLLNDWYHEQSGHTMLTLAILKNNKFPGMTEELLIRHVC